MNYQETLAAEFGVKPWQSEAVIRLIDEGNTLPFIARYRKEQHGSIDDQTLRKMSDRLTALRSLQERREEIAASLKKLEVWTEELQQALDRASTATELDDIYRPYRPKRKTRASVAREKGLEPLADTLLLQLTKAADFRELCQAYLNPEKGVENVEDALQGARDIIAERVSDDPAVRARLRDQYMLFARLHTEAAKEGDSVYSMYYGREEALRGMPSHRVLAMDRGEKEGWLKVTFALNTASAKRMVRSQYVAETGSIACGQVAEACDDAFDRLLAPSLETEMRRALTERAQKEAIDVFAMNLKPLLMQPPIRGTVTIGLDPGIRNGCKIAVIDETGRVLDTAVIFPLPEQHQTERARDTVMRLIRKHHVTTAAIGNGTAGRETEKFFADTLQLMPEGGTVQYMIVNEAGASVYSASELAAKEFPDFDVNLRSAVSIARRLQDPLAELVKIDPKAIGVGQYQHDLKVSELDAALDGVVEDCVNAVGVDVNTASAPLLSHISGINAALAKNIVAYREENGAFSSRAQLKKVPRLGPKAFEQAAGFLRVPGARDPIENTGVHPESYAAARQLLQHFGMTPADAAAGRLTEAAEAAGYAALAESLDIGEPTLRDIVKELSKPGRDPRDELPPPMLRSDVMDIKDLAEGMELKGTVRNVTDFGVFVDIGVHQDGLVHVTQLPDARSRRAADTVHVGDVVTVWVLKTDPAKKRISLTMRPPQKKN